MVRRFLLLQCFLLMASAIFKAHGEEPQLLIYAETNKEVYNLWEVIELRVTIKNVSPDTLTIFSPDFWGVTKIEIYDQEGELVHPELLKINRMPDEEIWKILPGESKSHTYDNLKWYSCCFGNMYTEKELPPGNYLINLSISSPPDRKAKYVEYQNTWIGMLYANTLRINISRFN